MVTRIEALMFALGNLNGAGDPRSVAFQCKNPLLLKPYSMKNHEQTESGVRVFKTFASGFDNCIHDLEVKCNGKSRTNLTPFSSLDDLVKHFGHRDATRTVKNFLRAALGDDQITQNTQLRYFTDENISALEAIWRPPFVNQEKSPAGERDAA